MNIDPSIIREAIEYVLHKDTDWCERETEDTYVYELCFEYLCEYYKTPQDFKDRLIIETAEKIMNEIIMRAGRDSTGKTHIRRINTDEQG